MPFGESVGLTHGGGSPGGTAHLISFPEHDLAFAAFGNGPGAAALHDRITLRLLRDHLGLDVPDVVEEEAQSAVDLTAYEGTYRAHQVRIDVRAVGGSLEETSTLEPVDDVHARVFATLKPRAQRFRPLGNGLFGDANQALETFTGPYARESLVTFPDGYRSWGLRLTRRTR